MRDTPTPPEAAQPLAVIPVAQRAALALDADKRAKEIAEYVARSKDIVAVIDADGREQAHRIAMDLREVRVTIKKVGESAREDAKKFSAAVIAEQKRLTDLISPEETRVLALRDAFDAQVKAKKEAAEKAKRDRIAAIEGKLQSIRNEPLRAAGQSAQSIAGLLVALENEAPSKEFFEDYYQRAIEVHAEAVERLKELHNAQRLLEEAEAQKRAEAEAEAARVAAQAEANRLAAAELERQRAEMAAQQKAADEARAAEQARIAAELQRERDRLAEMERAAAERQAAEDARVAAARAAEQKVLDDERAELQRQRDAFAAQQLAAEQAKEEAARVAEMPNAAVVAALDGPDDEHIEALAEVIAVEPPHDVAPAPREPVPEPRQVIAFRQAVRDMLSITDEAEIYLVLIGELEAYEAERDGS